MIKFKAGKKKCKAPGCGESFEKSPYRPFQETCFNTVCALKLVKAKQEKKENKEWAGQKKEMKEGLKNHSDLLKDLQELVNDFVRLRDKDQPCISCGTMNNVKYDAGHYYSRKGYSGIRFDEDNIHKQCSNYCNVHLSGNFAEYSIQLPRRIGQERFDALVARRHIELKISVPELKEKILVYKNKIAELKK